jgi:serine protease Do
MMRLAPAVLILSMLLAGCGGGAPAEAAPADSDTTGQPQLSAALAAVQEQDPAVEAGPNSVPSVQESVAASRRTAIVRAAERVAPAVVSVNVIRRQTVQPRSLYERFFLPPGTERRVQGLGSGFIIHEDGLVLTNEHVVRGAIETVVTLGDGRDFAAELVGTDEVNDLALLRFATDGDELPVAPLGESNDLLIGEWVVAIGNPFGYLLSNTEPTVTAGVVSGIGRNIIPTSDDNRGYYLGMIQTDASINPGNSGGPLVNAEGEVIGVNSSIFSRSGGSEGLGFAIPISRARHVVLDLIDDGVVRRPWTGLEVEPAEPNSFGRSRVVRVSNVAPGSPAEIAGIEPGMILRRVQGRPIRTPLDWEAALLEVQVGQELPIEVGDEGDRVVQLTPTDLPSLTAERVNALEEFELVTLTPSIRSERGLTSEAGALIVGVSDNVRSRLGLREGDLIIGINRTAVHSAEEAASYLQQIQEYPGRVEVRLFAERSSREFYVSFYL